MKILIVNTSDKEGGAARAAYRLHKSLLQQGLNSKMLVQSKISDDFTVIGPESKLDKAISKLRPILDSIPLIKYPNRTPTLFSTSWLPYSDIVKKINKLNPDLVHLHWVTGGMLRIEDIPRIKAPIVWTMHDNWLFTGGCHIMWECENYKINCGSCTRLSSEKENDLSRRVWARKNNIFKKLPNMRVLALSKWLNDCAKDSGLLKNHIVDCLPNPIDSSVFAPFSKVDARLLLNLPTNKKLIAFGAMNATSDINKGFSLLSEALMCLDSSYEIVVFGASEPEESQSFIQKAHYCGHLYDDLSLRMLYSSVDVVVVPSIQEAFGQTATESLSCGTPVVAFKTTGLIDIVDHKINGYLANPFDSKDLANGIDWVLQNENYLTVSKAAREKVLSTFDNPIVAKKYINVYEEMLSEL